MRVRFIRDKLGNQFARLKVNDIIQYPYKTGRTYKVVEIDDKYVTLER